MCCEHGNVCVQVFNARYKFLPFIHSFCKFIHFSKDTALTGTKKHDECNSIDWQDLSGDKAGSVVDRWFRKSRCPHCGRPEMAGPKGHANTDTANRSLRPGPSGRCTVSSHFTRNS